MNTIFENVTSGNITSVLFKVGAFNEVYHDEYALDIKSLNSHSCCSSFYESMVHDIQ